MTKINEILTLNLQEDIKQVIDLEDRSEMAIQQEIESYIVTEGIGRHIYNFTDLLRSNIKERGVWISGFYGSGKSYFGKMVGYIIQNPIINGTSAHDRFIPRLKGVSDENLIENSIRSLESLKSRVIFLDIAKQNTDHGFAFTLFVNLLKNLGLREDIYGYIEFDLFVDGKYDEFKNSVKKIDGKEWEEIKLNNRQVPKMMRQGFYEMGYSEADYQDTQNLYSSSINGFSAGRLQAELQKYLKYKPDETIVFIFDEASEAISQNKIKLLDLEGVSEALSSIQGKVWTVAIAQEKLDDVINNANVNKSQLTKVTDRFKTKIHLESTEVDVIIRSRLLHKKDEWHNHLVEFQTKNEGLISDITNLKSPFPTKTKSPQEFADYYPFHKYQFDILQKFLFSSNALAATQIAVRGMIITAFDVLRKQMREQELYAFTTGYSICTEAQTAPPPPLVNKYDTAKKILNDKNMVIDGEKLLKTIHLLSDSQVVSATVENITKSYISDINTYYEIKPVIEDSLNLMLESKVLLLSNNNYKITSDLEGRILDEMKELHIELYRKKRLLIECIKKSSIFTSVAALVDVSDTFRFSIVSDENDELTPSGSKQLKINIYSLFNINTDRDDFIEKIKVETQSDKYQISLIPDNSNFAKIDKLVDEIKRHTDIEEKYANESNKDIRQIIRELRTIREEKEKNLFVEIEHSYKNSSLVYMFDLNLLNLDTFKSTINDIQRKLIKNIFTKRLSAQLSDNLVPKVFTSAKDDLYKIFSGSEFKFFDTHGNFIGDTLKVIEEISAKIKTNYLDGKKLESELSEAPWGYSFGTIVVALAALFRAGRLSVKYNGETYFSHDQKAVREAFINTTKFKSTSFKAITATLTAAKKKEAVELLMNLESENHTGKKINWNINDFDLADAIKELAEKFIIYLDKLKDSLEQVDSSYKFDSLFPNVSAQKQVLQDYAGKITENNYIDKIEYLLSDSQRFEKSIKIILNAQKFIKKNFSKVKEFKLFIQEVVTELKKSERSDIAIDEAASEFTRLYNQDMVKNFPQLQQQTQTVKDIYFKMLKNAGSGMAHEYQLLQGKVDGGIRRLKKDFPLELNQNNLKQLENIKRYCSDRIIGDPELEFSVVCKKCGFSLSEILNYTALVSNKENELLIIQGGFVNAEPSKKDSQKIPEKPRKVKFQLPAKVMKVKEYKAFLTAHLNALVNALPDEQIEVEIE
ncbi:MAG: BREX system P-loop protein BrxC [Desulfamplus sp.]|nr:BREX system P-loop protein BrxC [Desulfamplus sp.]